LAGSERGKEKGPARYSNFFTGKYGKSQAFTTSAFEGLRVSMNPGKCKKAE
jgi:hypothetical protein